MEKKFEFDYSPDFTKLIEDKAISPVKEEYDTVYARELLSYTPPPLSTSRRVIIKILKRTEIDVKEICNKIIRREAPESWKIISLHPKERELKTEPRLFAMMVLEMRLYFCVTEMNISNTIFKYFPQQTMTQDELALLKRIYEVTGKTNKNNFSSHYPSRFCLTVSNLEKRLYKECF